MNRKSTAEYIINTYACERDHPWAKYPDYEVFRHPDNRKWFALIMSIPKMRIDGVGDEVIDVVNLKCDPAFIGSLLHENGFYPAYHMNKTHWITVVLDETASDDLLKIALDMSFAAIAPKSKREPRDASKL